MAHNTCKDLLSEFYGFDREPCELKQLSSSKGIECLDTITDFEYLVIDKRYVSSEDTTKQQNTSEDTEQANGIEESASLKSPHALAIDDMLEKNIAEIRDLYIEPDIIEDLREDKNIATKNFTRLEDTFTKAMSKIAEAPKKNDGAIENDANTPDPVTKAKRLWRQKTMLSKENLFSPMHTLAKFDGKHLDLNYVGLSEFPTDILPELGSLQMLYLDSNNITCLPDVLFITLENLKWLDVRNNQLTNIPKSVKGHQNLETLLLQGNNIEELPLELGFVPNLKNLQTAHNPLSFPPQKILDSDCTTIVNFLRQEWNNRYQENPINFSTKNFDQVEQKPSTIICLKSVTKRRVDYKLKNFRHNVSKSAVRSMNYKPSNRCHSAGENITLRREKLWMNIARQLLSSQAAKLQKSLTQSALENWRRSNKFSNPCVNSSKYSFRVPYATHDENSVIKDDAVKREHSRNFQENLDECVKSMDDLREMNTFTGIMTPRTRQKRTEAEIRKILELQRKLKNCKYRNEI